MVRPPIRALLVDLSGTLHIGSNAIPGAVQAIQRLVDARFPFRFCSNSSKESTRDVSEKLAKMGFGVVGGNGHGHGGRRELGETLWTSLGAVRDLVKERGYKRPYFLLSDSAMEEFADFRRSEYEPNVDYDSVIFGLAPELMTYTHLNNAFQILSRNHNDNSQASSSKPAFITTHKAAYIRDANNKLSLGPGPFVEALEYALRPSGVKAEVVGKPTKGFFERVVRSMEKGGVEVNGVDGGGGEGGKRYEDVAVIGDDVSSDLGEGAVELGLWRVLVRTGKYRPGDETREGLKPPGEVHDSFASFVDDLLSDRA